MKCITTIEGFVDLFDPTNADHLRSIQVLKDSGEWPNDFMTNVAVETKYLGVDAVLAKIAIHHIDTMLTPDGSEKMTMIYQNSFMVGSHRQTFTEVKEITVDTREVSIRGYQDPEVEWSKVVKLVHGHLKNVE